MKTYNENSDPGEFQPMLTDKDLRLLKNLEKNQEVIYLLNPEECKYVARLIKSYRLIKRQLIALQMSDDL